MSKKEERWCGNCKKQSLPKGKLFLKFVVPATVVIVHLFFFQSGPGKVGSTNPGQGNMIKSFFRV